MKPLRVALVVKDSPMSFAREKKLSGLFSYAVPEFTWSHLVLGPDFDVDTAKIRQRFDLVFQIDGSNWGRYRGPLPVVYYSIDSTLSEDHYQARYAQAQRCDLVLVDQGDLARFQGIDRPVVQFPYCVNDNMFQPLARQAMKTVDVGWYAHNKGIGGTERQRVATEIQAHCQVHGYTCRIETVNDPDGYAAALANCRIIVNWPRTPSNRPYRVFDTMACRTCLITRTLPNIPEDYRLEGLNILEGDTVAMLTDLIDYAMGGKWEAIADLGYRMVMRRHTWAVRAGQLRTLLLETFPGLGS